MIDTNLVIGDKYYSKFLTAQEECEDVSVIGCTKLIGNYHNIKKFETIHTKTEIYRINEDVFLVDKEEKIGQVLYPYFYTKNVSIFILQIFYSCAACHQIVQLHSSLIRTRSNFGLMFLGPSGIGKTTQAELWNQYRDALIINGDVVFVQETPDAFLGWGTPWHGSSPYCENTSVPVKALIVLKQAPENSIRELTGFEKVTAVSNNVFYPRWLEGGMELCLETLNHLLSALPVYELSCRPDEDAVRLTEEAVFGGRV